MLHSDSLSTQSREEFCLALKAARERSGVKLAAIADATKIPASMFAALERSDLRRWPKGLFRRSFFKDYVRMIGLPVGEACAEFVRLFPDYEGAELSKTAGAPTDANQANQADDVRLGLVLDEAWHGPPASVLSRLLAALIDGGAVILVAVALAWVAGADRPATIAIVSLAYFSLATAVIGESPAKWAMARSRAILEVLPQGRAALAGAWRRVADQFGTPNSGTPELGEEPEMRPWITDARRVTASRLRVRIKVS